MAVARYLTDPQPQQVNINSQGASPAGVRIDDSQPVQFNNNNSSSPISITFANTAINNQRVFNDIPNIPAGQSSTESPLVSDITVNYTINVGGNIVGPFAIEVGTGPMQISVTDAVPNPSLVVIPPNGEVLFTATDANCAITWKDNNDPFSPLLTEVYVGQANNQPSTEQGSSAKNFPYSLNSSASLHRGHHVGGGGGGTIKVT